MIHKILIPLLDIISSTDEFYTKNTFISIDFHYWVDNSKYYFF